MGNISYSNINRVLVEFRTVATKSNWSHTKDKVAKLYPQTPVYQVVSDGGSIWYKPSVSLGREAIRVDKVLAPVGSDHTRYVTTNNAHSCTEALWTCEDLITPDHYLYGEAHSLMAIYQSHPIPVIDHRPIPRKTCIAEFPPGVQYFWKNNELKENVYPHIYSTHEFVVLKNKDGLWSVLRDARIMTGKDQGWSNRKDWLTGTHKLNKYEAAPSFETLETVTAFLLGNSI